MSDEKPKHLIAKLAEIVREIDHVDKGGRNERFQYDYVKATDVARAVRKSLSAHNIYLVTDVLEIRNYDIPAKEGVMQAVDVKVQFSFFDGDAPETQPIVFHAYGTGTDKGDKAVYKAMTGALKYGLRHGFLIPDESDPENEKAEKAAAKQRQGKVVEDRLAGKPVPALFYTWSDESQTALITGDRDLMSANKDLLMPLKVGKELVANADQLESLKYQLEQRAVTFKQLKG